MDDQNAKRKRILIIAVALVALFAIGVIIWFFIFSKQTTVTPGPVSGGGLPTGQTRPPRFGFVFGDETDDTTGRSQTEVTPATEEPLVLVWNKPTAGSAFVVTTILQDVISTTTSILPAGSTSTPREITIKKTVKATSSLLYFVDRTTGYVYGYNKKSQLPYQISNTTIPGVYDAYIFNNGKSVLMRSLDTDRRTIVSTLATIPDVQEGENPLPLMEINSLQKNVSSVSVSASSQKISYVVPGTNGSSIYTLTPSGQTLTATSPFSEWSLSYGGEELYAQSKPSAFIEGSTVKLPYFTLVETKKTGLTSLPSPRGEVLNSMWSATGLVSYLSNNGNPIVLQVKTLSAKCSWLKLSDVTLCAVPKELPRSQDGLPDEWYQGRVLFNDTLQFIDARNGTPYPLYSFDEKLGQMDLIKIILSGDERDVSFIRKQNETLWLLKTDLLIPSGE